MHPTAAARRRRGRVVCGVVVAVALAALDAALCLRGDGSGAAVTRLAPAAATTVWWRKVVGFMVAVLGHSSVVRAAAPPHAATTSGGELPLLPYRASTHNVYAARGGGAYASGANTSYAYTPAGAPRSADGVAVAPLAAYDVWRWREEARAMLVNAYGAYAAYGYPWDEVRPLTCSARRWDARERGALDDALGGFSLTLVDSLDSLAVTGDLPAFRCAVSHAVRGVRLDTDVPVSVFESSIRVMGGLLAAHLLLTDATAAAWPPGAPCGRHCPVACLPRYDGQLVSMARELANRLLPAFDTASGIPYHRVNLRSGAVDPASRETCTAAAGTFLLEWSLLSELTAAPLYAAVARRATAALWARRSAATGLVGSAIDCVEGAWRVPHTGIGAGVDSYYEYLLKGGVADDDDSLVAAYQRLASAVSVHLLHAGVHVETSLLDGRPNAKPPVVSALQAFYPGVEVLAGHVGEARTHYVPLLALWAQRRAMPEAHDINTGAPIHFAKDAPLRPELLESTYHLYTATRDPALLWAAADQMHSLANATRVRCGYASVADVDNGRLDDRMDSYFIAETVKYAFMLFDTALAHWYDAAPHGAPPPAVPLPPPPPAVAPPYVGLSADDDAACDAVLRAAGASASRFAPPRRYAACSTSGGTSTSSGGGGGGGTDGAHIGCSAAAINVTAARVLPGGSSADATDAATGDATGAAGAAGAAGADAADGAAAPLRRRRRPPHVSPATIRHCVGRRRARRAHPLRDVRAVGAATSMMDQPSLGVETAAEGAIFRGETRSATLRRALAASRSMSAALRGSYDDDNDDDNDDDGVVDAADALPATLPLDEGDLLFTTEGHVITLVHPALAAARLRRQHRSGGDGDAPSYAPHKHLAYTPRYGWRHTAPSLADDGDALGVARAPINATERHAGFRLLRHCHLARLTDALAYAADARADARADVHASDDAVAAFDAPAQVVGSMDLIASELPPFDTAVAPAVRDAVHHHVHGVPPPHAVTQHAGVVHDVTSSTSPPPPATTATSAPPPVAAGVRIRVGDVVAVLPNFAALADADSVAAGAPPAPPAVRRWVLAMAHATPVLRALAAEYDAAESRTAGDAMRTAVLSLSRDALTAVLEAAVQVSEQVRAGQEEAVQSDAAMAPLDAVVAAALGGFMRTTPLHLPAATARRVAELHVPPTTPLATSLYLLRDEPPPPSSTTTPPPPAAPATTTCLASRRVMTLAGEVQLRVLLRQSGDDADAARTFTSLPWTATNLFPRAPVERALSASSLPRDASLPAWLAPDFVRRRVASAALTGVALHFDPLTLLYRVQAAATADAGAVGTLALVMHALPLAAGGPATVLSHVPPPAVALALGVAARAGIPVEPAARPALRVAAASGDALRVWHADAAAAELAVTASGATFGPRVTAAGMRYTTVALAQPLDACAADTFMVLPAGALPPHATALAVAVRGGCTFAHKARALYAAGAAAVVIVDTAAAADDAAYVVPEVEALLLGAAAEGRRYPPAAAADFQMAGDAGAEAPLPVALLRGQAAAAWVAALGIAGAGCGGGRCSIADLAAVRSDTPHALLHAPDGAGASLVSTVPDAAGSQPRGAVVALAVAPADAVDAAGCGSPEHGSLEQPPAAAAHDAEATAGKWAPATQAAVSAAACMLDAAAKFSDAPHAVAVDAHCGVTIPAACGALSRAPGGGCDIGVAPLVYGQLPNPYAALSSILGDALSAVLPPARATQY